MKIAAYIKNILIMLIALLIAVTLSIQFQKLDVEEHITTVFVFAVFVISLLTRGYIYGIVASILSMVAINFIFTYPYFAFDFINPINLVSAVILLTIAVITSLLVTKIKYNESAKAEVEKERMRANLLRAVSHDLRTPLTTISGASALLREKSETLDEESKNEMLKSIQEDADWLFRMVENLLSITRIDNETMKIEKSSIILDELVDSAINKFNIRHPDQRVMVEVPDDIVIIPMDSILIEQVILNLLENAVYHAHGMENLLLKVFTLGNNVYFEIIDDGCGIDAGRLKNIFSGISEEKFDCGMNKKRHAGIGLSVCSTIIKAHGGTISAENRKGGGALFRFSLVREENAGGE